MSTATGHAILLESGTNELEVLVFALRGQRYGVNVAKVREVIEPLDVTALPQSHEAVSGVFQLRETVTPLIDLQRCLGREDNDLASGKIIILEFNDARVGFLVDSVAEVEFWSQEDLLAPEEGTAVPLLGRINVRGTDVLLIDLPELMGQLRES